MEVRAAVLYEKPRSIVRSDYVWRRTDRWIDFPWSAEPPIGERATLALTATLARTEGEYPAQVASSVRVIEPSARSIPVPPAVHRSPRLGETFESHP